MAVQAIGKRVRVNPRKVSAVAGLVRGRSVADALVILDHTPRRSAEVVKKVILSAKANAEHNHGLKPDSLHISKLIVSSGPQYKRYRAAARGRALRYSRRTSNIMVVVDGEKRPIKKPVGAAMEKK